jgi:peptidyl-prolyl cis-trans isomerase D
MITVMRKYLKGLHFLLFAIIAVFIATSVFVLGKGSLDGFGGGESVAVVNGEKIPSERYQHAYQAYLNRYSQMYPGQFTPEMAERLGLRQQVINELVQEAIVLQRAQAEGLRATDEEVNAQIQAIPAFHENGVFSIKRYDEVLQRLRITRAVFEDDVRRKVLLSKVLMAVTGGVKISDAEVEQAFAYRREKARAAWALVDVAPILAKTAVSDAEVEAYYKDNAEQFRRPEGRRVQYVLLEMKDVPVIGDAEVEKYYQDHVAEFEVPRQVQVTHILARVPETGGSEAENRAKAKIQDAIRRAKGGEDFAAIARQVSEDPESAGRGGELGWVAKGALVPQFEAVAFVLKKGEVASEPVRTPHGYHAVKVLDVREGMRRSLKEATPQIRAKLLTERIETDAADRAAQARPPLQAATDFAAEAKRLGFEWRETVIGRPAATARATPVQEAAFALAVGGVSEVVKTPSGPVILKVLEHRPAAVPPLAEIRNDVANTIKGKKAESVALERAKALAAAATTGDLAALVKKDGLKAGVTGTFSRAQPADNVPPEVTTAALQQPVGGVAEPVRTPQGFYVVKTLGRIAADPADLPREREQTARELLGAKRNQAWESWVGVAREGAKIEVNDRIIASRS